MDEIEIVWPRSLDMELARQRITQAELARRSEIDQTRLSRLLSGQRTATTNDIARIAQALQVTADYLLFGFRTETLDTPMPTRIERIMRRHQMRDIARHDIEIRALDEICKHLDQTVRDTIDQHGFILGDGVLAMDEFMTVLAYATDVTLSFPYFETPADPDSGFALTIANLLNTGHPVRFLISQWENNPDSLLNGWKTILSELLDADRLSHWHVRIVDVPLPCETNVLKLNTSSLQRAEPILYTRLASRYIHNNNETVDIFDPAYANFTHHFADRHRFNAAKTAITQLWDTATPA